MKTRFPVTAHARPYGAMQKTGHGLSPVTCRSLRSKQRLLCPAASNAQVSMGRGFHAVSTTNARPRGTGPRINSSPLVTTSLAQLLEQAAKEMGEAYTNRRELTGRNGTPLAAEPPLVLQFVGIEPAFKGEDVEFGS